MLWFWLLVMWISPTAFCVLFVWLSSDPNVLTAFTGAAVGVTVALTALFVLH